MSFKTSSSNPFTASGSSSTSTKNQPVRKVDQHYENLGLRQPSDVIGSSEWGFKQYFNQANSAGGMREFNEQKMFTNKYTQQQMKAESGLITKILNYTSQNEWAQIEEGEDDKKWVTPQYPDKVFESGKIVEFATGETHYFPVASNEDDPLGIAMHYEVSGHGGSYKIYHNGYIPYGNARDRRYWKYRNERRERLTELNRINKELEAEALHAERLNKLGPERTVKLERDEKNNNGNN